MLFDLMLYFQLPFYFFVGAMLYIFPKVAAGVVGFYLLLIAYRLLNY